MLEDRPMQFMIRGIGPIRIRARRAHEAPRAAVYTPYVWFQSVFFFFDIFQNIEDNNLGNFQADQGPKCQLEIVVVGISATHVYETTPCCFGPIPNGIITTIHW
jgi:hypothetical protein